MKKQLTTLGIILLVTCIAVPVFAGRGVRRGSSGGFASCWQSYDGQENLTEAQRSELETLQDDFYADTAKIRHTLWAKTDELDILLSNEAPDLAKAKALQREISELKGQMAEKRLERDINARKIAPDTPFRHGYGKRWTHGARHMSGKWGGHRWGKDHGPCWKR